MLRRNKMDRSPPSKMPLDKADGVNVGVMTTGELDVSTRKSGARPNLLRFEELPEWQKDNEYVLTGYRPASGSWCKSLASSIRLHNETVNIHSHVVGSLLFFTLPAYFYVALYSPQANATYVDALVWSAFFYGVAICFLLSASFHVVCNHSAKVSAFGNQLDYLGIVLLMWGATIPSIYYGFFDDATLQRAYWATVSVLAIFCIFATLNPVFRTPKFRAYRAAMYAGLGLSAIVFIVHGLVKYGWSRQSKTMALPWMIAMAILNLIGASAYAARVPEKWYPEKFDIYGSSHQILHFMVILAGLAHMIGLSQAFQYVHTHINSL